MNREPESWAVIVLFSAMFAIVIVTSLLSWCSASS